MTSYEPSLEALRAEVDADIDSFLREKVDALPEARPLIDEISRVVGLGWKRLRPAFCYWGYRAGGASHDDRVVRAGSALELLHTFALVHDDIMDEAETRRGRPSTQAAHDSDFALLVGDLALVLADDALGSAGFEASVHRAAARIYMRMKQEVIAGQFLDYEVARTGRVTEEIARRIAVLKSGLYSVTEPLTIGAVLGGADPDVVDGLRRFGSPLGEAFQLRDDLLGLFGRADEVGKPVGADVREGKRNLLYVWTLDRLEGEDRERFGARWGADDLSDTEIDGLTGAVEASGARAAVEELLDRLSRDARSTLATLDVADEVRSALTDLAAAATERGA